MIGKITSIADLLFKAKTQEPYKQLLILAVKTIFNNPDGRTVDTYEKAVSSMDEYTRGITDCSGVVESINWRRNQITDPADVEFGKLFMLKQRQADTGADNARPSFNGEFMTISNNDSNQYSRASEEYERMRREANHNGYIIASQERQGRSRLGRYTDTTTSHIGTDFEVMERQYINPTTGRRHTVSRQVPLGIPMNIRREIEEELIRDVEREIERHNRRTNRYSSYWDDDINATAFSHQRISEDNPYNDR